MGDGAVEIRWPEEARPELSAFHAVNQLQMAAAPEHVWGWLCRPDLWPRYYANARLVRRLDGQWPQVALGSRFRWFTFGVVVTSQIVEFEPQRRLAWSARELGAKGHHGWVLDPLDEGTFVHTEETQRGWAARLTRPLLRPAMVRMHQRWLQGLAKVAAEGPPPPPGE